MQPFFDQMISQALYRDLIQTRSRDSPSAVRKFQSHALDEPLRFGEMLWFPFRKESALRSLFECT